jgi:hypothetical protein
MSFSKEFKILLQMLHTQNQALITIDCVHINANAPWLVFLDGLWNT